MAHSLKRSRKLAEPQLKSQLICSETIVNYISGNFVTWAWDMTHDTNRTRFLDMVTQHFGSVAASTVRGFGAEQYPLLLVGLKIDQRWKFAQFLQGKEEFPV
ncbi:pre-rRNA processing and 40S ribosomal subunit assembly [Desmophyllum pertusum]|uniref:Pre-rRNA processing and 40S ribosomal subunit assembly n=1 Tax=Desmophyllum pertusum TaxID=174260 RepID=A0A9X0D131_9CNID|nr:pre-rRNA processing and 40S ribosomal subunit assembly [Desmophyllum pertusum]